jgi:hypothetical protein
MPQDEFAEEYFQVDEDPMELVGLVLPGEAGQLERMAEVIVEEYVRMGWDEKRLMVLFTHPMFQATHRIYQLKGEAYVGQLLKQMCSKYRWNTNRENVIPISTEEVNHA